MTRKERRKPDILQASRKRRIAAGAGVDVAEINRLLKQHRQMQDAFKMMARGGGKGFARMAGMLGMGMPGGGNPMDALKMLGSGQLSASDAGGAPTLPNLSSPNPSAPPEPLLPGLGGPSLNPFRKP
jgi:signal recognition particle subunit SRP54